MSAPANVHDLSLGLMRNDVAGATIRAAAASVVASDDPYAIDVARFELRKLSRSLHRAMPSIDGMMIYDAVMLAFREDVAEKTDRYILGLPGVREALRTIALGAEGVRHEQRFEVKTLAGRVLKAHPKVATVLRRQEHEVFEVLYEEFERVWKDVKALKPWKSSYAEVSKRPRPTDAN
jgi:hypothetical protein